MMTFMLLLCGGSQLYLIDMNPEMCKLEKAGFRVTVGAGTGE